MGVLACDRSDCDAVMCDNLILDGRAYICDDCLRELGEASKQLPDVISKLQAETFIFDFLRTSPKGEFKFGTRQEMFESALDLQRKD